MNTSGTSECFLEDFHRGFTLNCPGDVRVPCISPSLQAVILHAHLSRLYEFCGMVGVAQGGERNRK